MAITPGAKIQPFTFADQTGATRKFPDDFKGQKTALFFLRHLGCPLCKAKVAELKAAYAQFQAGSVLLIVVVQSTPRRVSEFAEKEKIPYLLVPDRGKILYNQFEVRRGGLKEFTAPAAFAATVRATLKGHMHGRFEGDEFQVPAAFLLSPEAEVLHAHYGKDVSDFGGVDELLAKA
ncbi:MAG TPA: peroxiredoxin-like family protein [bacterium]|nr:peroxiredoxin-like family protein [bacterium]